MTPDFGLPFLGDDIATPVISLTRLGVGVVVPFVVDGVRGLPARSSWKSALLRVSSIDLGAV